MSQGPGGNHGPGHQNPGDHDPRYQGPQGGPGSGPRRRTPLHWTVGLVAAAALGAGGIVAGISLAGHPSPAASTSAAPGTAAGPSAQAAALNSALNSAGTPGALALTSSSGGSVSGGRVSGGSVSSGSAAAAAVPHPCASAVKAARAARKAGHPAAARAVLRAAGARCLRWRHRLVRVPLLRGIDGQFTFRGRNGALRTLAFERGVVQSASGSNVVVRATDGTTWTWDLVSSTVVRESGTTTSTSALATGEPVWVGGPVVSGARNARLVLIRPPSGSPGSSSPSPVPPAPGSSASGS